MKSPFKLKTSLAALAVMASFSAAAAPLTNTSITGNGLYYTAVGNTLVPTAYSNLSGPTLDALLGGSLASPGGNVELSKLGGPVTSLTGYYGSTAITLSSLTLADWSTSLVESYINAAAASIGATLSSAEMATASGIFLASNYWKLVSDPNLSYVDVTNGQLNIGLAGYYDATPVLTALFSGFDGISVPAGSQASEVVKVSINGSTTYLFGFDAEQSLLSTSDPTESYTGTYAVSQKLPEPGSLALLGLGLAGLMLTRRKSKNKPSAQ